MTHTGSRSAAELRAMVRDRDGDNCWLCGKPIDFTRRAGTFMGPSLEHAVPRAAGGTNALPNLRLAHAFPCNHAKGAVFDGQDWSVFSDPAQAKERQQRKMAAAAAVVNAAGRKRLRHEAGGGERARQLRRAKTGARAARGPWGGLIVVEERGPWGGIVTRNYGS